MLRAEIITPDGPVFQGDVDSVTIPTGDGEITVLPRHVPLVSTLVPGTVILRNKSGEQFLAVTRGVVEVDGKHVRLLAQTADRAEQLEEEVIERAKQEAERLMTEKRHDVEGFAEATAMLERELARLRSVRRFRSRRGNRQA